MKTKKPNIKIHKQHRRHKTQADESVLSNELVDIEHEMLSTNLATNEQALKSIFQDCSDVVFRSIQFGGTTQLLLVYIGGVIDTTLLDEALLKPLLQHGVPNGEEDVSRLKPMILDQLVAIAQTKTVSTLKEVAENIVRCSVVILLNGENVALVADLKKLPSRAIEEPTNESSIRGPREGFTENLGTNTGLIRKRIRNPKLKMEPFTVGVQTNTDIVIAYIQGIASEDVLQEVWTRIRRIKIDGILDSGNIEELIQDRPWSPFPQVQNTERPDTVASALLQGRIAIAVDGTPFVLLIPMTFWMALGAVEDYYERFIYTSAIRLIRFVLLLMSLFFPSLFVAATTFHPQMLPTNLILTFAAAREPSPFPAVVEAFLMEFMFEALREAGLRLPRAIGSTVSIVGALVIGQAAVQAGIVSASIVIVVASTGIASFAIPRYNFGIAFRLLRFPMLALAGTLGFYGIAVGVILLMIHLSGLRSFGVPYLAPVAPGVPGGGKNVFFRPPIWAMTKRPELIVGKHSRRIPPGQGPRLPQKERRH